MLMVISESFGKTRTLIDVARELSLNLSYFADPAKLDSLMEGKSRRFVLLAEEDLSNEVITSLDMVEDKDKFGLIVCADPEALRSSNRAELIDRFGRFREHRMVGPGLQRRRPECRGPQVPAANAASRQG